jgi:NADH:ubiquinone oxidoreductase subunit 5 (subunit L)/multisubunit Na+/H+ antiporter MnhA subunit
MSPGVRRAALTAHVTTSVGWLGAVIGVLALAVAGISSDDDQTIRAAYLAM